MRRSPIVNIALVLALALSNCVSSLATDSTWRTNAPGGGGHLLALRFAVSPNLLQPRLKSGNDRASISTSPCDRVAVVTPPTLTIASAVDVRPSAAPRVRLDAPAACRPPPLA